MLYTNGLGASDQKDHVYAILGITGFPATPLKLADWFAKRSSLWTIPIDCTADISSILATVTWSLIMKYGLIFVAKFKAFRS
jgi:hypothetical protein